MMKALKLISMLLVCAVVFSLAAVNAFAVGVVDSVNVEKLLEPVIGWEPDYSFTTKESSGFEKATPGAGAIWWESEDGTAFKKMPTNYEDPADRPIFQYGYYYKFETELRVVGNNIWETKMKSVTVNGRNAAYSINGELLDLSIVFGPLDYEKVVANINLASITAPEAGKAPSYNFTFSGAEADFALPGPGCFWYESSDGGLTWKLLSNFDETVKFKDGCMYKFYTEATARAGYELSGQLAAYVDGSPAFVKTVQSTEAPNHRVAQISIFYGPLGTSAMSLMIVGDSNEISTYSANTITKASVIVMNTKEDTDVTWYECDGAGEMISGSPVGTGLEAFLPGIPSKDMMVPHYIKIVAQETSGSKRAASLIVPYMLLPAGFEEDPGKPVSVTLKGGVTDIVTSKADTSTYVEAEITEASGSCSVDWFRCDDAGNIDWANPIHHGYNMTLPGIDAKDAGKVFKYAVYAEDGRGGAFAGKVVFTYKLEKESSGTETANPADNTGDPSESPADGDTSTPSSGNETAAVGETDNPDATPAGADNATDAPATAKPANNGKSKISLPMLLLIILGSVMVVLLCALCVLIGVLLARKKNEK